jgi:MFS family permease
MKEARENFASDRQASSFGWMSEVSRYQWLVLLVAWLGWVFDSMDGTLFSLVQKPAITELLGPGANDANVGLFSSVIFCVQLLGWAAGGIAFGVMADYLGRTRALAATILIYSIFTGLSAVAANWWQLALFRFITGLGLGGEWAAGAALVAEVWPNQLRARAGAILQSAAAVGFFLAGLLSRFFSWRTVFVVGAIPASFVLFIRMIVKEPEAWTAAREKRRAESVLSGKTVFTLRQLFGPLHRRDTVTASALAFVALLALWGGTMWIPAAIREISAPEAAGMSAGAAQRFLAERAGDGVMLLNVGSLFGYLLFSLLADRFGRRPAFLFYFVGGAIAFPATFLFSSGIGAIYLLLPVLGFFTLGVTSGFPIYLPELFPTHLRTTGVGFCYNLGRSVTAAGVFITGALVGFFGSSAKAASAVSLIYLPGLLVLLVARETRGQKLV